MAVVIWTSSSKRNFLNRVCKPVFAVTGTEHRVATLSDGIPDLDEGDVLVTKNTSAGFNVVLSIIGALVTDRGGILSHAAIVSREYGIPGVIGTKTATQIIKDGDRIRVDGDKGEVTVLS